ncbi:MAG: class I tRNA ligase family protein, partial [Anaerolineaceae bacterium]|nr:class I tRNA ligase family protein [Anaerolineaceae bacterium]
KTNEWLEESGNGEKAISYHLRDWIFSRQHYWGEPIPMIHCKRCGWVPVPEDQLPVVLPEDENYQPTDTGESPLANIVEWVETICPQCSDPARRETDTMPNWAGSDWYFLRFIDPHNEETLGDMEKLRYWMPVDVYVGGDEHNTLHLLYSRFIYQFLFDIGVVPPEMPEPYIKRLSHGVILGTDNARMSKSHGNVVVPDSYIEQYGADALRTYLMFIGPFDATMAWNERAFLGVKRFLDRFERFIDAQRGKHKTTDRKTSAVINKLGKIVGEDIAAFKFNTAVAKMMEALNTLLESTDEVSDDDLQVFTRIIAPFAPFLAQETWEKLSGEGIVHHAAWPQYNPALELEEEIEISVQVNGRLRGLLQVDAQENEEYIKKEAAALEGVAKHLNMGEVVKVIYVKGRTVNFVVKKT